MPYASTAELPSSVKKLPPKKRRQWMHVFNSTLERTQNESRAFAAANSVAKAVFSTANKNDLPDSAFAYISPGGKKDSSGKTEPRSLRHLPYKNASGKIDPSHVRNALARLNQTKISSGAKASALRKLQAAARSVGIKVQTKDFSDLAQAIGDAILDLVRGTESPHPRVQARSEFLLTKDLNNRWRWFTHYSNMYRDRDGDILTKESHEEFAAWCANNNMFPELWLWHTNGSRIGKSDWVGCVDGFACASGLIDASPEATNIAESLAVGKAGKLAASHGFLPLAMNHGVCTKYRSFEVTVLPYDRAANPYTDYNFLKVGDSAVPFTEAQKSFFKSAGVPDDHVVAWETSTAQFIKSLKDMGIEYKDDDEESDETDSGSDSATDNRNATDNASAVATSDAGVSVLSELLTQQATMTKALTSLAGKVADLSKSDDEKIADAFKPAVVVGAAAASKSDDNIVGDTSQQQDGQAQMHEFFKAAFGGDYKW